MRACVFIPLLFSSRDSIGKIVCFLYIVVNACISDFIVDFSPNADSANTCKLRLNSILCMYYDISFN